MNARNNDAIVLIATVKALIAQIQVLSYIFLTMQDVSYDGNRRFVKQFEKNQHRRWSQSSRNRNNNVLISTCLMRI